MLTSYIILFFVVIKINCLVGLAHNMKIFFIQLSIPDTPILKWKANTLSYQSFDEFNQELINFILSKQVELSDSIQIELFNDELGVFTILNDQTFINHPLLTNSKPIHITITDRLCKQNDHILSIKGRFFDRSKGLLLRNHLAQETRILIQEEAKAELGTGLNTWDGSILLAKYLEKFPEIILNKNILEVGAGTGVSGIAASFLGGKKVLLTDLEYTIQNLQKNIDQNKIQGYDIEAKVLDWMNPLTYPLNISWDVIIGADVVWLTELVPSLVNTLITCARPSNAQVILSHQVRYLFFMRIPL